MTQDAAPKLLVVADEPKNLHTISRILASHDLEIVFASSGEEALREVLQHNFFLILMDVQKPELNGLDTARLILGNKKTAHLPIIFVTATSKEEQLVMEGYDAGAVDYIYKPVNPFVLASKVSIFRDLHERSEALRRTNDELAQAREALKQSHEKLSHIELHDSLTGLANRKNFANSLSQAILRADRARQKLAIFFLDLDNFKTVNDTLGHDAGDELLKTVASRLRDSVRKNDLVARFGGDEFAVLMENIRDNKDVAVIAEKMLALVGQNNPLRNRNLIVTPSIGIAVYPIASNDQDQLMEFADIAMYRAKKDGRNAYRFYSEELQSMELEFSEMRFDLRRAIDGDQLEVHYQPQIDTKSQQIIGFEALVRWNHPEKGLLSAKDFITVAEQSGLIREIGARVLEEACTQYQSWRHTQLITSNHVRMSVNVSALQIRSGNFVETIDEIFAKTGMQPDHLELEVTESTLIDDLDHFVRILNDLDNRGISIAMDDFGTGFASYRHLQHLPVHHLKIDRGFIARIQEDERDLEIVSSMITMAKALGLYVTAEGVELFEQAELLKDIDCDRMQGYFFARPDTPEVIERLLEDQQQHAQQD